MSHSPRSRPNPAGGVESTTVSETSKVEAMLGALEDEDCRAILEATADESLTANELSEACDLPLSTAYRKLELLTETGLLDEQLRISRNGKHTSEYARSVEDVHVSIENDIELSITRSGVEEHGQSAVAGAD
ncbi:Helix-turn-helix domain-containing protein [Halovenus aranensis]|jgi:DNA-binding transcriptional ArsR family regulator|uniref:Helix-turn-helix domain-containing protein n=1 Tax=Halovenus aranensis TaxID=890420 RepID=A0A1G8V7H9_9EURY|nr:helix-turn-helix domain-containing protein [Halovenus aranensis]SDJ62042.1 Helix-turn-helix domain-containing protein [Halovenus aranensis]